MTRFFNRAKILVYALKKGCLTLVKKAMYNALEKNALALCGELRKAKAALRARGVFSKVTGSGSALFCFDEGSVPQAIDEISSANDWLIYSVQTF